MGSILATVCIIAIIIACVSYAGAHIARFGWTMNVSHETSEGNLFSVPEQYRVKTGLMASDSSYGNNGAFLVPHHGKVYKVIASAGDGWEHVSISAKDGKATPSWEVMCAIKELFWDDAATVIQFHPRKSEYINNHPGVLHLWRKCDTNPELPDSRLV